MKCYTINPGWFIGAVDLKVIRDTDIFNSPTVFADKLKLMDRLSDGREMIEILQSNK